MTLGGRRFLLGLAVVAAGLCLAFGVSQPFVRLTPSLVTYEHSLISAVSTLMQSGQLLLGAALLIFGLFLPVMKFLYLMLLVLLPQRDIDRLAPQLRTLEWLGLWSLQDVLVLSLTVVLITHPGAHDAGSTTGFYFFAAAVLLMLLAHVWLRGDVIAVRLRTPATAHSSAMRGLALVFLAGALLALGVMVPAIRLSTRYAGTDEHSIATVVQALYGQQEYFAAAVLLTLAVLLPCLRLLYLLALVVSRKLPYALRTRSIRVLRPLGGHATTDVMILALMAFYLTASGRAGTSLLPGAYAFAASALATMLAYGWANSPGPAAARGHTSLTARLAGVTSEPPAGR